MTEPHRPADRAAGRRRCRARLSSPCCRVHRLHAAPARTRQRAGPAQAASPAPAAPRRRPRPAWPRCCRSPRPGSQAAAGLAARFAAA